MVELLEGIGHNIRRLREAKGWNQTELGFHADMSPSIVSLIENGKRNPSTATLAKIASALEVEVVDLFPKASAPPPELPFNGLEDERRIEEAEGVASARSRSRSRSSAEGHLHYRGALEDLSEEQVREILEGVQDGRVTVEEATRRLVPGGTA